MAAPRAPLVIEVEHAREWLRSRGTLSPGELTIARAELMKRVKSLDGVVAEVVAPHVSDAARLWAELSDGWSSALAELERDGHASRSAITGGLSSKQLSDIDAVVQKAGPSALRECAEACLSAALVELPALARDRGASRARHLALSRAAASAERSAVLAERRAKSEADALGLDADGVPTGAELAGALLRGAAVRAAAAFCSARARASHGAAGADAVAVPSLEAVWRGASPLSERSDVIEDLQVMLAFLLAAERDTAALQEDARAALADGAPALALLGPAPRETAPMHRTPWLQNPGGDAPSLARRPNPPGAPPLRRRPPTPPSPPLASPFPHRLRSFRPPRLRRRRRIPPPSRRSCHGSRHLRAHGGGRAPREEGAGRPGPLRRHDAPGGGVGRLPAEARRGDAGRGGAVRGRRRRGRGRCRGPHRQSTRGASAAREGADQSRGA